MTQINKNHILSKEKVSAIESGIDQDSKDTLIISNLFHHKLLNTTKTIKEIGMA